MTRQPPPSICTARLVVRCWDLADAPRLKEAIDTSRDHLRPWMPWAAAEPTTVAEKAELLRTFREEFRRGRDFVYGIFSPDERQVIGGTGLHTRIGDDALEIGYWVRASRTGQGLATEAVAALTSVAFTVCRVDRVEIHVEPTNPASLRIPAKLGFAEETCLRRRLPPLAGQGARRDVVIFTLFAEEYPATPAAAVPFQLSR